MPFIYTRPIHFQDTDAAGVVFFANVLVICHEAYEMSLHASGIDLKEFFQHPQVAVPIIHASVDFYQPLYCGDRLTIHLTPEPLSPHRFAVHYQLYGEANPNHLMSRATTRHVCIHPGDRHKVEIPDFLQAWQHQWGNPQPSSSHPESENPPFSA